MGHDIYALWRKIDQQRLSNNGEWVAYTLGSYAETDPTLYLWRAESGQTLLFPRGTDPIFSEDSRFILFRIKQPLDSLKAKRRKKIKDEDLPKDSLGIYNLSNGQLTKIASIKSFALPQKWAGYCAIHLDIEKPETPRKEAAKDSSQTKKPKAENKDNGSKLILYELETGRKDTFAYATEYTFAKRGKTLLVADTGRDSIEVAGIRLFDCEKRTRQTIFQQKGKYKQICLDESGKQAAFIADLDTTKERVRPFQLFYWQKNTPSPPDGVMRTVSTAKSIAQSNRDYGDLKNYLVSENAKPQFSEDGTKLYFGFAQQPILPDTTLLPEEIVNVEVWAYDDPRVHTQQKVQLERDRKRSFDAVYLAATDKIVPLSNPRFSDITYQEGRNGDFAILSADEHYLKATTWEGFGKRDIHLVDIKTGAKTLIASKIRGAAALSPSGKYVIWYNEIDSAWFTYALATKKTNRISDNVSVKFYDEENDMPDHPNPYGIATWTRDDRHVLIYDRYDIWKIDPLSIEKPIRLTYGKNDENISRYIRLDEDEKFVEPNATLFLHQKNDRTKAEAYAQLNLGTNTTSHLISGDYAFSRRPLKAQQAQKYVFSKTNFTTCPDLLYTTDFKTPQRISDINPQQADYAWGSIEMVAWTALNGQILRGMLVKPEGFDPTKKYPMIVNFYEKSSDEIHAYRAPEPHRSQINYTFYANHGYLVFNPDIPYRIGYPGESCLNAVISGVTYLMNKGFVDEKRIGVQGHSWGGYQAAYLITKTDIFRCAESGAPVVNMISAYSGIRWESGLMRQFQYEHSQSRIGGSLWEYPLRFMENSPVFSADKINTPVLILHNDKDGAVPWYQGIEFYGAMRRLNKPAWLLNYNDEPHWPLKLQNRIDFQKRMQQFFDHYLKDAPMPRWMVRGVPAMEKAILQGFELERK
jgi:dipeptidyl aminopeptidase/acylaminoacyl peptidase